MNDDERYIEEYVKDIPFEDATAQHRDILKAQLLGSFGNQPHAVKSQWVTVIRTRVVKLAAAAVILLAMSVLLTQLNAMWSHGSIAWADVAKKFQSVPFFGAAIYMKDSATSEPTQIELWWRHDGHTRLRIGTQVIFGLNGQVVRAFDVQTRQPVEANRMAALLLAKIAEANEFSLNSIIKTMFGGKAKEVTPQVNPDAAVSQDMVVFDVDLPGSPVWVRIWALRESRVPIRIRVWDPTYGHATDAVFEYSKGQPDELFDPNAFAKVLGEPGSSSQLNIAYAFLKDPGGEEVTPGQMFEKSGYHVPHVEQVGMTANGAVWAVSTNARNQKPNGNPFFGFGRLQDDLGRQYVRLYRGGADRSGDVFVPMDYPFDTRVPKKVTLICEVEEFDPRVKPEVIGTVDVTQWQQGQPWPADVIRESEKSLKLTMARQESDHERYDFVQKILAGIEGDPASDPDALRRETVYLHIFLKQRKFKEARVLAERLVPLLEADYVRWKGHDPSLYTFQDSLVAFCADGKLDEAGQLWEHVKTLDPEFPKNLAKNVRDRVKESIRQEATSSGTLEMLVHDLSWVARLTVEQIDSVLKIDVKKNDLLKNNGYWDWDPQYDKPAYLNWDRHLTELAEYYKTHPLPEQAELLKHTKSEEYACRHFEMPGIEGYTVEPLRGNLKRFASMYKYPELVGRIHVEAGADTVVLDHDFVCRKGVSGLQTQFVLNYFGWEMVETKQPCKVWVAHYDGRALKDYREVHAPLRDGDVNAPGRLSSSAGGGILLSSLFHSLTIDQDPDTYAGGAGVIIIDETGIGGQIVSQESAAWRGPKALEPAKKWFADQFGVTFTEETRELPTYIVRKKP